MSTPPNILTYGADYPPDLKGRLLGHARAALGPTIAHVIGDDFEGASWYQPAVGASPNNNPLLTGGWVSVETGAGAGGIGVCRPVDLAGSLMTIHNPNLEFWEVTAFVKCVSAAADSKMVLALRDSGGGLSPAFELGSSTFAAGGAGNFSAEIFDNTGTPIYNHDTGVVFDNLKHLLRVRGDKTNYTFWIDDVLVGLQAIAGNATSNSIRPELLTYNGGTAVNRILVADYLYAALALGG